MSVPDRAGLATNADGAERLRNDPLFVGNVLIASISAFLALLAWILLEWYRPSWDASAWKCIVGCMAVAGICTGLFACRRGLRTVVLASVAAGVLAFLYFWVDALVALCIYSAAGGKIG